MPSLLLRRDFLGDAKDTLSSWDKCMAKTYCKWPVIVAIIVVSLTVLSIVLCVARCICCGAECACCCFRCCACCSCGRSGHKRMKSEPPPPPPMYPAAAGYAAPPAPPAAPPIDTRPLNQQYRSHAAPAFHPAPERPQFATFDGPAKPVNEDALPAMPSWGDARSRHVEEEVMPEKRGDMEMDRLNHNGSTTGLSGTGAAAVGVTRRPRQPSPVQGGYGPPQGYQNDALASRVPQPSPNHSPAPYGAQYGQQQDPYRHVSPIQPSLSPVYGAGAGAGYAQGQQFGRRSPGQAFNQQYDQSYQQPPPRHTPSPPRANDYASGYGPDEYAQAPARSHTPGYVPSVPSVPPRYETPAPSYPGQPTYESSESAYPGQQSYQAFNPSEPQGQQYSGITRKPVDGSWREV
ncbi:hypothetical protein BDV95DRAFT_599778 [Massariosphaeria phaeospora]|uniref:Fibroin-3 related protein n=1 Tax=Massariosphaeria phaeospora TaxID=100035 RepID=A0A7C8MER3_9PLEO|nr:hypothetical protein BDV95DRAFT_599778 [Massariosphaeria phaeospora]